VEVEWGQEHIFMFRIARCGLAFPGGIAPRSAVGGIFHLAQGLGKWVAGLQGSLAPLQHAEAAG
jgi:hypothetical protein